MSVERSGSATDAFVGFLLKVRHYWWVVLTVVVLAVLAATLATVTTPTTFTARASLIVSSNDRSPDQDAVLVQGYVTYFNDPAYQIQLLSTAKVGTDVTVEARAAAASPILLVDATARQAEAAQTAAARVAQAFKRAINRVNNQENAAEIADLRERLNEIRVSGDTSNSAQSMVTELEDRILQVQSDRVNMLQELQLAAGVSQNSPSLSSNILFALLGGLLLGSLAALGAARLSNRLRTGFDVEAKVGLNTLIELPPAGAPQSMHDEKLRQLASKIKTQMPDSAVLAVTAPGRGAGTGTVAAGLAREWARQGFPTLLVRTGAETDTTVGFAQNTSADNDSAGFTNLFGEKLGTALTPWVSAGPVDGMWVLNPAMASAGGDLDLPADSMYQLLAHTGSSSRALVILEAPGVVGSADAQVLCAASGRTIVVIDPSTTGVPETVEAVSILEHLDCGLLGAVLLHVSDNSDNSPLDDRQEGPMGVDLTADGVGRPRQASLPRVLVRDVARGPLARARASRTRSVETGEG